MEEDKPQSQSPSPNSSSHGLRHTPSQLRLCSSNVGPHLICTSRPSEESNSDAGVYAAVAQSNCARYKLMSPANLPIARSPSATVPPGLSPKSLLDSPVLLSNMKVEPSPTTGSFSKHQSVNGADAFYLAVDYFRNNAPNDRETSCFEFNPQPGCDLVSGLSSAGPVIFAGSNHQGSEAFKQVPSNFQSQSFRSLLSVKTEVAATTKEMSSSAPVGMSASGHDAPLGLDSDGLSQRGSPNTGDPLSDHNGVGPSVTAERSSGDGYNWRKYGQKLVKGSEFPRSYYKCTHPNCEVKKISECCSDGQLTESVYKGTHDHPKPQISRRSPAGAIMSFQEMPDRILSLHGEEDNSSINAHVSDKIEQNGYCKLSPCGANDDSTEGRVSPLNSTPDGVDEDDSFLKRRKLDVGVDVTAVVKPIREPRVVVQTVSEVDILDDGYRWRKYGQKVVRGNPNPRSYYKCSNAGCPVRKHVERASHDPKAVINAYDGKHNHDVPTAKTSSQDIAGPSAANGMPRNRSEVGDAVSLDLGVGVSPSTENEPCQHQQRPDTEPPRSQIYSSSFDFRVAQVTPIPTYYGIIGTPPMNHSSNPSS